MGEELYYSKDQEGKRPDLSVTYLGLKKEQIDGKEILLHEHTVTIDTQTLTSEDMRKLAKINNPEAQLTDEDIKNLKKFEQITPTIWSQKKIDGDWHQHAHNPNTFVVPLASGLASDHRQWKNEGCSFIHRTAHTVDTKLKLIWGDDLDVTYVALSHPGFIGSELVNEKKVTPSDVGSDQYAQMLSSVNKLLGISPGREVAAAHSAGGKAVMRWAMSSEFIDAPAICVFNPAVWQTETSQFKRLGSLSRLADIVQPTLPGTVNMSQEAIVKHLLNIPLLQLKLTPAERQQIDMTKEEMSQHPEVFQATCDSLSQPETEYGGKMKNALSTLIGAVDRITPQTKQQIYLDEVVLSKHLEESNLVINLLGDKGMDQILQVFQKNIVNDPGGHCAIFMNSESQERAVNLLIEKIDYVLLLQTPQIKEFKQILGYLKSKQFPVFVKYEEDTGKGISTAIHESQKGNQIQKEQLDALGSKLKKAETLCRWKEAEKTIIEWGNRGETEGTITVTNSELENLVRTAFVSTANKEYFQKEGILTKDGAFDIKKLWTRLTPILFENTPSLEHNHLDKWLMDSSSFIAMKTALQQLTLQLRPDSPSDTLVRIEKASIEPVLKNPLGISLKSVQYLRKVEIPLNSEDIEIVYALSQD